MASAGLTSVRLGEKAACVRRASLHVVFPCDKWSYQMPFLCRNHEGCYTRIWHAGLLHFRSSKQQKSPR